MNNNQDSVKVSPEEVLQVNGIELCAQSYGDAQDPAILLIGGAEASMDWWDEDFCDQLAAGGRYVIRYDSRDTGRSTTYPVGAPTYTQDDMLGDAVGLLDAYRLSQAGIVGVSGGGMLAQLLAIQHPERVRSLTLIATTPGGGDGDDRPLPPMDKDLARKFEEPDPGPDWTDRDAVIVYFIAGERDFAGTIPVDEERVSHIVGRAFDRSHDIAAASNHWMIEGGPPIRARLGDINQPTLVLHGTHDPLFPYGHGEALAQEIPGAELLPLQGMGHQMPPPQTWDVVIPAIIKNTAA